jgi:hypothetical protein
LLPIRGGRLRVMQKPKPPGLALDSEAFGFKSFMGWGPRIHQMAVVLWWIPSKLLTGTSLLMKSIKSSWPFDGFHQTCWQVHHIWWNPSNCHYGLMDFIKQTNGYEWIIHSYPFVSIPR